MDVKIPLLINSQSKRSFSGCKMFSWHQDINSSIFISSCTSPGGCSCPPAPKTRQRMARGRRLRPLGPKRPRWPKPPAPALASPILRESWENGATPNIWDYIPMLHAPDIIGEKVYYMLWSNNMLSFLWHVFQLVVLLQSSLDNNLESSYWTNYCSDLFWVTRCFNPWGEAAPNRWA